jgi:sugar phosphate isomerase/epimerase
MRTCLNLVTLQQGFSTLEGIKLAASVGFEGAGIWADDFEKQADPIAYAKDVAAALCDSGLHAEEMCFVGGWMWAEGQALQDALDQITRRAEIAAAATCPIIIACASGGIGCNNAAAEDFRRIGDIGAQLGVDFALEYIGPFEQVKDIPSGLEIVRLADHPNCKLLIDIFHTFRGGSTLPDFDLPMGNEVGLVHMNDVPAGDVLSMNDLDRVMPGAGVLPLKEAMGKLQTHGFEGALSVEVFNRDWWAKPPAEVAAAAFAGLKSTMP